jgi:hypothetical protein
MYKIIIFKVFFSTIENRFIQDYNVNNFIMQARRLFAQDDKTYTL